MNNGAGFFLSRGLGQGGAPFFPSKSAPGACADQYVDLGGGVLLGLERARMCVSKMEGNGSVFGIM